MKYELVLVRSVKGTFESPLYKRSGLGNRLKMNLDIGGGKEEEPSVPPRV